MLHSTPHTFFLLWNKNVSIISAPARHYSRALFFFLKKEEFEFFLKWTHKIQDKPSLTLRNVGTHADNEKNRAESCENYIFFENESQQKQHAQVTIFL